MAKTTVSVDIVGDASTAVRAFQRAQRELSVLERAASVHATGIRAKLSRIPSGLKGMGGAVRSAALPLALLGGSSLRAFQEAETANAQLLSSLKNNPKLAGASAEKFRALAAAIQLKTAADDESVISGIAALGNFDLTQRQIEQAIPLVVDYARRTGKDVPSAAQVVGKAMLGNAKALKEIGVNFKSTGDRGKDFAGVTDALRAKVGGFAEQEGKTSAGQMAILRNRVGELQEKIGAGLVPVLGFLQRHLSIIGPLVVTLTAGVLAYKATMVIASVVTAAFGTTAAAAWTAAALPVALVVAAVVAVGLLIWKFRDKVKAALGAVGRFFAILGRAIKEAMLAPIRWLVDKWLWAVGLLVKGAAKAFGWMPGIGGKLKAAAREFDTFRDDVNRSLGGIRDKTVSIGVVSVYQNKRDQDVNPGGRPSRPSAPRAPTAPRPRAIGRGLAGRGGGGMTNNFYITSPDHEATARAVAKILGRQANLIARTT